MNLSEKTLNTVENLVSEVNDHYTKYINEKITASEKIKNNQISIQIACFRLNKYVEKVRAQILLELSSCRLPNEKLVALQKIINDNLQ